MHSRLKRRPSQILRVFVPFALAISVLFNILTILRLKLTSADNRQYSMSLSSLLSSSMVFNIFDAAYIDDDHPTELPLHLDTVALTFNSSEYYSTSGLLAWSEWNSLDHFPRGHGFVRLGPNGITTTSCC